MSDELRWKWNRPWALVIPTTPVIGLFLWSWKVGLTWLLLALTVVKRER